MLLYKLDPTFILLNSFQLAASWVPLHAGACLQVRIVLALQSHCHCGVSMQMPQLGQEACTSSGRQRAPSKLQARRQLQRGRHEA